MVFLAGLVVLTFGCTYQRRYARDWEKPSYPSLSALVVDAETGTPIEGAVVFCLWTREHGVGLTYTKVYKVEEAATDKEGRFHIGGVGNPLVNPPDLTVYKRGYVAWNNMDLFPQRAERKDFGWKDDLRVKMEKWKEGYSFVEHEGFIALHAKHNEIRQQDFKFFQVMEWERDQRVAERRRMKGDSHE